MLYPALMTNGPCGLGSRQCPMRGIEYSPPVGEDMESIARVSPRQEGSKCTSTSASVPVKVTDEAAVTDLSTLNSELSIYRKKHDNYYFAGILL